MQVNVIESFRSNFSDSGNESTLGVNPEFSTALVPVLDDECLDAKEAARESCGVPGVGVVDPDDEGEEEEELVPVDGPEVEYALAPAAGWAFVDP